jgi:5-methylcytosine-specific restriction endonuclease McrBC regulatory subunit McrC
MMAAQLRQNVTRGRLDRIVCRFQIPSRDTLPNQILRAALEQSLKWLRRYQINKEASPWHWASFALTALSGVSLKRIMPQDFKAFYYRGFLKPYQEPHWWARLILQLLGYDPLEALPEPLAPALPPLALDMSELFERYCEALLRKQYAVWAGYKDQNLGRAFWVRPDFLIADGQIGWIVDAKYKRGWSWGRDEHRNDVFQAMAYSRHKGVVAQLKAQGCDTLKIVLLYPQEPPSGQSDDHLDLHQPFTPPGNALNEFQVQLGKLAVSLPVRQQDGVR